MVQRTFLPLIGLGDLLIELLVLPIEFQRLRILRMGVQILRQLLDGKGKDLHLRQGRYRQIILVDHAHKG